MAPPPPPKKPVKPGAPGMKPPTGARPLAKPGAKPKPKLPQKLPDGIAPEGGEPKRAKRAFIEMNRQSWIMAGASAALTIVSIILLVISLYRFMAKRGFEEGVFLFDSNRRESAAEPLAGALKWDEDNLEIRELLAKVYVETDNYAQAQTEYDTLEQKGSNRPTTYVGRGVCCLREADRSKEPARIRELANKAKTAFQKALSLDSSCLEARIGLASAKLLEAAKLPSADPIKAMNAVGPEFGAIVREVEGSAEKRALLTREGFIDLYAGYGKANYRPRVYAPDVHDAFRKAYQFRPAGTVLMNDLILVEAQKFFNPTLMPAGNAEKIVQQAMRQKYDVFLRTAEANNTKLKPAAIAYYMSFIYWLIDTVRNDKHWGAHAPNLMSDQKFKNDIGALSLGCYGCTTFVLRYPEDEFMPNMSNQFYKAFLEHPSMGGEVTDERLKRLRVYAWNNGALSHWMATIQHKKRDSPRWKDAAEPAKKDLGDALKVFPDDYVYNRNLALVLWFVGEKEAMAGPLGKAEAAAAKAPDAIVGEFEGTAVTAKQDLEKLKAKVTKDE